MLRTGKRRRGNTGLSPSFRSIRDDVIFGGLTLASMEKIAVSLVPAEMTLL
jgi:hypothetical protein